MIVDSKEYNILIIEDNLGDYIIIKDYLDEVIKNPRITHLKTFKEAKELLAENTNKHDVILLDLSLPDKSGETLIQELTPLAKDIPIIVLTGYSDIDFSVRSLSIGASDYLFKDDINSIILYKSIIYCIERKKNINLIKESEKRYSDLFHLSPQPMWTYDAETYRFIQVNNAAIDLYGFSEEEFLNMTMMDILLEEDIQKVKENLQNGIGNKTQIFNVSRHYKKSKEIIEVDVHITPIQINNKLYMGVIATDITKIIVFEKKITEAIIKSQEDERYHIGSELHDNVCQILAASQINLGMLKDAVDPSYLKLYNQIKEYIVVASDEIRNLSHELAPAFYEDTTIEETLLQLIKPLNETKKIKVYLQTDNRINSYSLNRDIQLNLYRILQEQLNNIIKHSKASEINIHLSVEHDILSMSIADNGIGFNLNAIKKGIGMANMKRRSEFISGKMKIESSKDHGCIITIEVPVH